MLKLRVIKNKNGMFGIQASCFFSTGEVVYSLLDGVETKLRTQTSVQVEANLHVEDEIGRYINHHCDPTCEIQKHNVVAIKDINIGDEITFDYVKNEDFISSPFICACCNKLIK